jgi:phenylpropionate dioxygenase-like ring-hydroxylating dioxygenase large terminal subunit
MFPLDRWYVAGFSREFSDKAVARTLLGDPVVLFRADGILAALEDRCCHRHLPLSCGHVEANGIRCGYHGLLFAGDGRCLEIPGQAHIPSMACVRAYPLEERNQIVWIWMGRTPESQPTCEPPAHPWHDDPSYQFSGETYHYKAPWQLIHDNLLDLSHLGYVHTRTIGGNAQIHVTPEMTVEDAPEWVRVVRHMRNSEPPPTYLEAWPFDGRIDRWQEIEFHVSHFLIWTGGMEASTGDLHDPHRCGFHMRGFHGITPETESTSFYFWTISSNRNPARPDMKEKIHRASAFTFDEDRTVIEAQYANWLRFPDARPMGIHVDAPLNKARRIVARLTAPV